MTLPASVVAVESLLVIVRILDRPYPEKAWSGHKNFNQDHSSTKRNTYTHTPSSF